MADFRIELRDRIADWLADMEPMFDRRCKLTFVMRAPHLADGDLIVTGDDIPAVIKALKRLNGYDEVGAPAVDTTAGDLQNAEMPTDPRTRGRMGNAPATPHQGPHGDR